MVPTATPTNRTSSKTSVFFQYPRTGAVKCIRSMGKQNPIELRIYSSVFYLVSVLSMTSLVSSQLSYHVDSLVDTRNAMLTYSYEDEGRPYLHCVLRRSFKFVASLTASYFAGSLLTCENYDV